MANLTPALLPSTVFLLQEMGERLRLARLRRRLQAKQVAERAGMSVITLRKIERGDAGVTVGAYCNVLQVLQFQTDLKHIGAEDPLGRRLQDIDGNGGMRVRRVVGVPSNRLKSKSDASIGKQKARADINPTLEIAKNFDTKKFTSHSISSDELIGLLDLPPPLQVLS